MNSNEAIELIKFYEEAAGRIKERTWTIAAWILSLSSGLIAFCYSLDTAKKYLFGTELTIQAACLAGIGLCLALGVLLFSQGEHLREYYALQIKLSRIDEDTRDLFGFKPMWTWMPWFIWLLLMLSAGFIAGFVYTLYQIPPAG